MASRARSSRVIVFSKRMSHFSRTAPDALLRICKNASYSPCRSDMKCSVPLGRLRIAWRLMISLLAARVFGYCRASSCKYRRSLTRPLPLSICFLLLPAFLKESLPYTTTARMGTPSARRAGGGKEPLIQAARRPARTAFIHSAAPARRAPPCV